jgi:hypothetical protein
MMLTANIWRKLNSILQQTYEVTFDFILNGHEQANI